MKKTYYALIGTLFLLSSCNPRISTMISKSYPPIDYKQEILVLGINETLSGEYEILGQVKIGDTGFSTNCTYDIVINNAKLEARKAGGNAIKIVEHTPPAVMGSSCHRITAKILKIPDIQSFKPANAVDSAMLNADYALLHVYRNSGAGALVSYDLNLGDSVLCRVKNKWKTTIRIEKDGYNTLWARTEAKQEIPVKIEFGKEYYMRCGITVGAIVGRPSLILVDNYVGKAEYEAIKMKNRARHDRIILKDGRVFECKINIEDDDFVHITIINDNINVETKVPKDKIEKIERAK